MGRPRRVHCRLCGKHVDTCGPLSARGNCSPCGVARLIAQNRQMKAKSGPIYEEWCRRMDWYKQHAKPKGVVGIPVSPEQILLPFVDNIPVKD